MPADAWLLIGPRGSRRVRGLQQALRERGLPAAQTLDYETVLDEPARAAEAIARRPRALVKIESPGEAPRLHAGLIENGWRALGAPGPRPHPLEHGELAHQHYWYAGFRALLESLPQRAHYLNAPDDIAGMSDKLACQTRLQAAGIAIPPLYGPIDSHADLRERLRAHGCTQAFVKSRYGSSGAGVLAYRCDRRGREVVYGSAELGDSRDRVTGGARVFNSLRPRRYTQTGDIARLIDAVAAQGAYVERWIAKPRAADGDGHYDIRAIALDARARQRVARVARGPLTNLHLGNRRGDLSRWLDDAAMGLLETTCERAAAVFARSRMIGFDLILRDRRAWVLEANAFGDLLPNLHWQGLDSYQDQAALMPSRHPGPAPAMPERAHG